MAILLWHHYPWLAYAAVLTGVVGYATSEFVSVPTGHWAGVKLGTGGLALVGVVLMVTD